MQDGIIANESMSPAIPFLRKHGHESIVSLGCGPSINRIDNHLRLMIGLELTYYVGIDCQPSIELGYEELFMDPDDANARLSQYYQGKPNRFLYDAVKRFPNTFVEELVGLHCAVIICQRILPDCRWEEVIISMSPKLVLQEDLHGCERQQLRGKQYVRTLSKIRRYGLQPFRAWPIFPWENNLLLWRRRDFDKELEPGAKNRWWRRAGRAFIG
ncbi:MAG: hypothetical protein JSW04_04220 [Desulfobacterales bacterium]|nr:MAG: hypothetical protein JSW04_04220 [Desulfobacterales bacterium]